MEAASWRAAPISWCAACIRCNRHLKAEDNTHHLRGGISKIRVAPIAGGRHLSAGGWHLSFEGGISMRRVVSITWRVSPVSRGRHL